MLSLPLDSGKQLPQGIGINPQGRSMGIGDLRHQKDRTMKPPRQ
jgi:hypothetical protein